MSRQPSDPMPGTPDARGERAPGTDRGTTAPGTRGTGTGRGVTHGTETGHAVPYDTDADRAATPGTGTHATGTHATAGAPGTDPQGTGAGAHATGMHATAGTPGTDPQGTGVATHATGTHATAGTPGTDPQGIGTGTHPTGTHATTGTPGTDPQGTGVATGAGAPGMETPAGPGGKGGDGRDRAHLFPHEETGKLGAQLQHAVAGFVDGPRAAVEEADHVLEEIAARFTEAVAQRRRTLRHSWQSVEGGGGKPVSSADTEQLRLALKDYRELAERLMHV
ncbi:hypothetical protein [Streptomyces sp. bgisy032]|uniref:hypothetical protein n=1 Tax=Streptomyces sp. bgisy032 TaxID=3413773 RepID=UPI003D72308A